MAPSTSAPTACVAWPGLWVRPLDLDRLWTVDAIRAVGYEVKDPPAALR
jgi:hypothetical protein